MSDIVLGREDFAAGVPRIVFDNHVAEAAERAPYLKRVEADPCVHIVAASFRYNNFSLARFGRDGARTRATFELEKDHAFIP